LDSAEPRCRRKIEQSNDGGDGDEFALPVLHRLEPELGRRHVAKQRNSRFAVLRLFLLNAATPLACSAQEAKNAMAKEFS